MSEKTDGKVARVTILSDNEIEEIRQIMDVARGEKAEAARIEYYKKLSSLRSKARWNVKNLLDKCRPLAEYRDAEYVGHKRGNTIFTLPGGKAIGFGWAGHASGAAGYFYETFQFWGFESPRELFTLPKDMRDEFFDKAIDFVQDIFGKDAEGLERLMTTIDQEEDAFQLRVLQLKAEDMTTETRTALTAIAKRIKAKAEAAESRSLQIKLRNRLGAARFYLEGRLSG